jgi:phosphomannomutase
MINWCPIGRNANNVQRKEFINYDKQSGFREKGILKLRTKIDRLCPGKVIVKMGGDTSFDIYPTGWDKTYALRHFPDKNVWFVGDRCEPSGNDYEIYEALRPEGRSFKTTSTFQTQIILRNEIIPKLKHP